MGKAGGVAVIFFGVILNLMGLAVFFGMLAENTIMLVAGPILILCFLIFAAGTFLMYKGVQMYNRPPKNIQQQHDEERKSPM